MSRQHDGRSRSAPGAYATFWLALAVFCVAAPVTATPLAMAGDSGLRHDIELLADAGIITGPVLTWPLAWPQVDADLRALDDDADRSPAVAGALARVRARLHKNKQLSHTRTGVSRSSQFGGDGRHVGFDTLANVITGKTTSTSPAVGSSEGINSLGGGDIRWKLPYVHSAVYTELIGEDEKGSRPDLFLAQGGIEFWGGIGDSGASWRLAYEYTDTKADAFDSSEREGAREFGIAYNNGDFPTGYRYRGRAIGYPADGDALLHSVRAVAVTAAGSAFRLVATTGQLNRGAELRPDIAARNSLTPRDEDVNALDLGYSTGLRWATLDLGLGYTHRNYDSGNQGDTHAWIGLSREFD